MATEWVCTPITERICLGMLLSMGVLDHPFELLNGSVLMGFTAAEREKLLAIKGVGETVISRLEQIGFSSLGTLADQDPAVITRQISQMMGSTCWHNSPMARRAATDVIALTIDQAR